MCFGTFDLLHLGHLHYFQEAKKQGDYLIVVIARDQTKQKQQKDSLFSEKERRQLVQSLKIVDEAVLGNVGDHLKIIMEKRPDVLCLGYDHAISESELAKRLAGHHFFPTIIRCSSYLSRQQKGSILKRRILERS